MALFEVGNKKDYKTISSAIEAASDGDEIIIEPGYYAECFEINKELFIHGSLDLTKAKNNFSSDDIPIIYIKSFETLRITGKCQLANILFTQKKDLSFGLLSEALVHPENACEITGDKIIHDLENEELETMVEISADVQGKNCFFIFGAYHGLTVLGGTSQFQKTVFSNCYGDDIFVCNDSILKLENNCCVKNTLNGYGIYANGNSNLYLENSNFAHNECASIKALEHSSIVVKGSEFISSEYGVFAQEDSNVYINDCKILKNKQAGIFSKDCSINANKNYISENNVGIDLRGNAQGVISETTISNNIYAGLSATDKSSFTIENCNIKENEFGVGLVENSTGTIEGCIVEKNSNMGVVLNKRARCSLINTQLSGLSIDENCCIYAEELCSIVVINSVLKNGWAGLLLKGESKTKIIDTSISHFSLGTRTEDNTYTLFVHNKFINNESGLFCGGESKVKIFDNQFLENERGGILLTENVNLESYKCSFENNKKTGIFILGLYEKPIRLISCNFSDNIVGIANDVTFNKELIFINCTFNDNSLDYHNCSNVTNINSKNEAQKLYKQIFEEELKALKQININDINQKTILSNVSIDIISDCLLQINEEFGKEVFYVKNTKKVQSICKDLYPKNDDEISFIMQLCQNGLLEQLSKKKLEIDFFDNILRIGKQYTDKTNIGILIMKFETIFQIPLQNLFAQVAGDE